MCVALPGKVIKLYERNAIVDFGGNQVTARAGLVEVKPGDHVLVHAGCIIQRVTLEEAQDLQKLMEEMGGIS